MPQGTAVLHLTDGKWPMGFDTPFFLAEPGKVLLRHYRIKMMKSGTRVPKIELEEMGQSIAHYHYQNGLQPTSGFEMRFCYRIPAPWVLGFRTKTRLESRFFNKKFNPHFIYYCFFF